MSKMDENKPIVSVNQDNVRTVHLNDYKLWELKIYI